MAKNLSNNQILLKEIAHQEFSENDLYESEDSFFEFFAASQVLKNYALSDDEVAGGILGGGNDGGCDGMYIFLNNELITSDQVSSISAPKGSMLNLTIIQAKNTTGFGENAIMAWKTVSTNLLDMNNDVESFADRYSVEVRDAFVMFRDCITKMIRMQVKIQIQYYYVTLATEVHPNTQSQADELQTLVKALYPSAMVSVEFVDANKLMELYNSDTETNENLVFSEPPISRGKNTEYISLVNLGVYYKFITDENGKLHNGFFEANVRDYQGKNSVNSSIAETLANKTSEDFWWLNNGITILADAITPITSKELTIKNPAIVNGLQTSTEIFNYFSDNKEAAETEQRNVLVRVVVPADETSRDTIIFATNNQTNIPKASLRVTDAVHLQIELYFKSRGLYYDRRKNYYKNQKKKTADIVGVSFLAQCLITLFLQKPDFARARPSTLLNDEETYKKLYLENVDLEVFYRTALLGKRVMINLAKTANLTSVERNDILYYLLYASVARTLNKKEISFIDVKNMDMNSVSEELINSLKSTIYDAYIKAGGNSRVAKNPDFIKTVNTVIGL